MDVYKTLSDEIIADEVADNQARPAAAVHSCTCAQERRSRTLWVPQTTNAVAWMREMMDYNVPLGKLNRGLAVLDGELRAAQCCKRSASALPPARLTPRRSSSGGRCSRVATQGRKQRRAVSGYDCGLVH
jgi:hypothetical protein